MSLKQSMADVDTECGHNRVFGTSLTDQLRDIKLRHGEAIDALIEAVETEIEARGQALARIAHGEPHA